MTDQEHASAIHAALSAFNRAFSAANRAGLVTEIDVIESQSIEQKHGLPMLTATVSREIMPADAYIADPGKAGMDMARMMHGDDAVIVQRTKPRSE